MWKVFKHWFQLLFQIIEKKNKQKQLNYSPTVNFQQWTRRKIAHNLLKQKSKYQKNMEAYQSQHVVHPIIVS